MKANKLLITVRGKKVYAELGELLPDGSSRARIRGQGGSSIRGTVKQNSLGVWRFAPSNKETLDSSF